MIFAHPHYLWLLLLIVPLVGWYIYRLRRSDPSLTVSTVAPLSRLPQSWKVWLRHAMFLLDIAALATLVVILARPQTHDRWAESETEGTDIVIALDVSTSMMTPDMSPIRFEAAKEVACQFIAGRDYDNIGVVIFAGESFTLVPMTTDHSVLVNYIQEVKMGMLQDLTAIGDGIATSINRIKNGKAKSKSIILITDGTNNAGIVEPLTAAEIAKQHGIKIYTIGIGSDGRQSFPIGFDPYGRPIMSSVDTAIDENTLKKIADVTGGTFYRATDTGTLGKIFDEIDRLEKTQMDVKSFSHTEDDYLPWAWLFLALVTVALIVRLTILREIP